MTTTRTCNVCGQPTAHYVHPDGTEVCVPCYDQFARDEPDGHEWTVIPEDDGLQGTTAFETVAGDLDGGAA